MNIEELYPLPIEIWQIVAEKASDATFFHTPYWAEILSLYYRDEWQVCSRGFQLPDHSYAILPALKSKVVNDTSLVYSMSPGVYGGLIAERNLESKEVNLIYSMLCKTLKHEFVLVSNPLNSYQYPKENILRLISTRMLNLNVGFDQIWQHFSKGHKSSYKKAERIGVKARQAKDLSDYQKYYEIYEDSIARWGEKASSKYDRKLFEILHQNKSPYIKLWLAEIDKIIISGALVFYWNNHVVWWHGANKSSHLNYCGANFLQVKIINDAINKGYQFYDFNPSGSHAGVENFKRSFGAYKKEIAVYRKSCND